MSAPQKKRPSRPRNTKNDFVRNEELIAEIVKSKARLKATPELKASAMTPALARMLVLMVDRYALSPNWYGYSYNDEMKADAVVNLTAKWHKFDETRFGNAFAYYTQILYNSFIGTLHKQKKQQSIKDSVLIEMGHAPSLGRLMEDELRQQEDDPVLHSSNVDAPAQDDHETTAE